MDYPFKNFVFEGGGVKGIAYVGALQALQANSVMESIQRVGGTSAGAINAVLLALGYSLDETYNILSALNFKNFMDDDWGVFRDAKRLIEKYGIYKGDFFREWMGARIAAKTGSERSTFEDLKKKGVTDLYLVGTNLSTGYSEVFSWEHTGPSHRAKPVSKCQRKSDDGLWNGKAAGPGRGHDQLGERHDDGAWLHPGAKM